MWALLIGLSLSAALASSAPATRPCFDLSTPPTQGLRDPLPYKTTDPAETVTDRGTYPDGTVWAALRTRVPLPIDTIRSKLSDVVFVKDDPAMTIKRETQTRTGFDAVTIAEIKLRPVPFMSVNWTEEWTLNRIPGTPTTDLVSYHKIGGTDKLERLCGSMMLRQIDPQQTDLFLYEEVRSQYRTDEETLRGHHGTIKCLRRLITP